MLTKKKNQPAQGASFQLPGATPTPATSKGRGKGAKKTPGFERERLTGMHSMANQDVLNEAKQIRRTQFYRVYAKFAFVATPPLIGVLALGSLFTMSDAWGQTEEIKSLRAMIEQPASTARAEAQRTVEDWLASSTQSLPNPELMYWEASETLAGPELEATDATNATAVEEAATVYEKHRFKVYSGGVIYTTAVQTSTLDGVTTVLSAPSLSTDVPSTIGVSGATAWPGSVATPVTEDITRAAQSWAEAYASGDSGKLRAITGDTSGERVYLPLAGAKVGKVTVDPAAAHPSNDTEANMPVDAAMVRVSFPISFDPAVTDDDLEKSAVVTFDLLIRQASTTAPVVTSWGEPGSGPTLEDYSAALPITVSTENGTDAPLEAPAPSVAPADERTDTDTAATAEDTE